MASEPGKLPPVEYVDHAVSTMARRLPEVDLAAMRITMLLSRVTNGMVADIEKNVHRPRNSSWAECRFLMAIWILGSPDAQQIARVTGVSKAAVSALAQSAEAAGHVTKTPDSEDRRRTILTLTEKGRQFLEGSWHLHNARESLWTSALLPGELHQLVALLEKLGQSLPNPPGATG